MSATRSARTCWVSSTTCWRPRPRARRCCSTWTTGSPWAPAAGRAAPRARRGLNENYGRELMELHTLGVDGGYTQKDVTEVARCFTGWTIRAAAARRRVRLQPAAARRRREDRAGRDDSRRRRQEDGAKVLDIAGAASVHRALHFEQAGAAVRGRRSAARAGGPHGGDVPQDGRRHPRGDEDHVRVAGVLLAGRLSRQGEDAVRDDGERGARVPARRWISRFRWRTRWRNWASRSTASWSRPDIPIPGGSG